MEFITSNKGSRKLLHEGYAYTKKNANKSSIRWECSQRMGLSCKGALNSDLLGTYVKSVLVHSHPSDYFAIQALKVRSEIKESAKTNRGQPGQIVTDKLCLQSKEGCFYHLTQATWRRVQAEGLQSAYNNDEDVKSFCAKLDGLAFLPPNDVKDGMAIIREQATEELLCLVEYFDSNYVNGVLRAVVAANGHMRFRRSAPRFPPDIWNVHNATIQDIDRTNNQCESWNNAFKHLVGHANPSLWNVISCIGKDACMVAADVLRCDRGEPPQKRVKKATKTHQQRLKDLCLQYLRGDKSLEEFLSVIGQLIRIR